MIARHARITVIALVATISCGRSREPADVSNQRDVSVVTLKAGKAHEELRKLRTLDYAYPFGDPGNTRRTRVGELFLEACKAGHRLSCGSGRDFLPGRTDFAPLLRANCVAGDVPSCRAMYPRDRTLRGGIAPDNCTQVEVPDRAGIEKECADGFPDSCFCLAMASPPVRGLSKRAWQLHLEGCALNQVGDCYTVTFDVTGTDGLWGATRWCMLGGHCWTAATMLMKRGRRIETRN